MLAFKKWCPKTDSNRRPTIYETVALPAELLGPRGRSFKRYAHPVQDGITQHYGRFQQVARLPEWQVRDVPKRMCLRSPGAALACGQGNQTALLMYPQLK
jgi:hypothetical protein